MERTLDRLHARVRGSGPLQRLAVISRILLAVAFIPTGLVKLLGERFTAISVDDPIGLFFEAMYQSGAYWNFLGAAQVFAGILLLIPRTATLGALLFFPIVLNIFVITVSLHFRGTPFITGLMLLASTYLLCWDYDRLKGVVWPTASAEPLAPSARMGRLETAGYVLGTAAALGFFLGTRGFATGPIVRACLVLGFIAVLMVLAAWIRAFRFPSNRMLPG
jgi:uncharacterized membrane protein YphA (DoxX/SURF4 family)